MANSKFKIGDRVRPIPGKKQSNNKTLKDLEELIITDPFFYGGYKKMIRAKIIHGSSEDNMRYDSYRVNQQIELFEDCLELIEPEEEDYEIY